MMMKKDYKSILYKAELIYSRIKKYHAIIIKKDFIPVLKWKRMKFCS